MLQGGVRTAALASLAAGAMILVGVGQASAQEARPVNLRGQIQAVDGNTLTVRERSGQTIKLVMNEKSGFSTLVKASLADIKPGTYVGTAAEPLPDGKLKAQEVLIFQPGRRPGEGHGPWDLTPRSTMTNADVGGVVTMAMGAELKLKYKDGEKTVVVAPDTPIVAFTQPDKSLLKAGSHFMGVGQKQADGSYTVVRISVGKDGLVPPM
jgi:hypothetical protein